MARRTDERPRHEQIAAELRARIMAGDFPPGTQLPSTQRLVDEYNASNPTIQRALRALKREGYLISHQGKGVYVQNRQLFIVEVAPYFTPTPGGYSYDMLNVAEVQPPPEITEALKVTRGATAILRRRVLRHNGSPVELDDSYYPLDIVRGSELERSPKIRGGAPRVLADLGYPQRQFTDRVAARMPTTEEIELLDLPEVPVMRQFRVVYSDRQRPVEVSILIKGAHLYELLYHQAAP